MPRGRHLQIRQLRAVLLDADATVDARRDARAALVEMLDANYRDGRPAYKIRLLAAQALLAA